MAARYLTSINTYKDIARARYFKPAGGSANINQGWMYIDGAWHKVWQQFIPYSETSAVTNGVVPFGAAGAYVTLCGGGGSAGAACSNATTARGGGGGGGGGAFIPRIWVPRSAMGANYTIIVGYGGAAVLGMSNTTVIYPGNAGGLSRFISGGVNLLANGGGAGPGGGRSSVQSKAPAATYSIAGSGVSGTGYNGGLGTDSGAASPDPKGPSAPNNPNGAGGGGCGGSIDGFGALYGAGGSGGDGKAGLAGEGGARAGTTTTSAGKDGASWNSTGLILPGAGGGGGGVISGYGCGQGGDGGWPGGGGGGSSGTNSTLKFSGKGESGYVLVEWVLAA